MRHVERLDNMNKNNGDNQFSIEALETMQADVRKNYYLEELKKIIDHAYRNASAVRKKFDGAGFTPSQFKTLQDLDKIPILKKEELKEDQSRNPPFGGYLAVPMADLQRIYVSPGPIYDPEEKGNRRLREARMLHAHGFGPGERVLVTLSYHMVPAGLLFDKALREAGALVIPAGIGGTDLQVQVIKDLQVTGYIGTATFLMNLIQKAEEKGYSIPGDFPVKTALLTAEGVSPVIRQKIDQVYNIHTWQGYGTADIGLFAYECREVSGMHLAEDVFVEIIDPNTCQSVESGETGEVVVTHFNKTYPLIRFGTGDLSYLDSEPCSCGRTSPRLVKIVGRVGDSFKVRGLFVHGSQVQEAMSAISGVAKYCMVIAQSENRDELNLKVELEDQTLNRDELTLKLINRIKEICGLKADTVKFVDPGTLDRDVKPLIDNRIWK
jgi:phenylacetate-CoA ligase